MTGLISSRPRELTNHQIIKVLLTLVNLEQRELAFLMGFDEGYVANVLAGFSPVSKAFVRSFSNVLTVLLLNGDGKGLES